LADIGKATDSNTWPVQQSYIEIYIHRGMDKPKKQKLAIIKNVIFDICDSEEKNKQTSKRRNRSPKLLKNTHTVYFFGIAFNKSDPFFNRLAKSIHKNTIKGNKDFIECLHFYSHFFLNCFLVD
jgi:hypothetical protein